MLFVVIGICALVSKSREGKQSIHPRTFGCKGSRYGLVNRERITTLVECVRIEKSFVNF